MSGGFLAFVPHIPTFKGDLVAAAWAFPCGEVDSILYSVVEVGELEGDFRHVYHEALHETFRAEWQLVSSFAVDEVFDSLLKPRMAFRTWDEVS